MDSIEIYYNSSYIFIINYYLHKNYPFKFKIIIILEYH